MPFLNSSIFALIQLHRRSIVAGVNNGAQGSDNFIPQLLLFFEVCSFAFASFRIFLYCIEMRKIMQMRAQNALLIDDPIVVTLALQT